ncbi:hypothetical protein [Rhodococcus sp. ACS1]|uniref:hypothetical protein n=1 Tax=Rhodococcus sp. ACS1 TaxID=2028570 RepID=UPI00117A15D4|nr:hypothetical protein [Rhodococcus sp. ACS1]
MRKPIAHGTNNGYQQHKKHKTEVCVACRMAHNAYNAERRRLNREENPSVTIPIALLDKIYWQASPEVLAALDQHFGAKKLDALLS